MKGFKRQSAEIGGRASPGRDPDPEAWTRPTVRIYPEAQHREKAKLGKPK